MFYDFAITVPADTSQESPVKQDLQLGVGVIHRVEVQFPIGTRANVHLQVRRSLHQLWPSNTEGDFASDGHVIAWDEHYELSTHPLFLTAIAWSTADTYDYIINIRIGILPKEVISPFAGVVGALRKFLKVIGVGG